ncbi:protein unc-93 homolog A-like [Orbicella faveolata]|uniref:protein unc-93 homolog A-like n=1 Tax=Orbicella faveolata TaxID=48498 RepID=UPI0009E1CC4A|nr:protein unc-93 homolog A-like [Orbicella faveolata]XP_020619665.1 protein unc-93 homolog A-like [Orbicella faveolata]XP_020619669.1 protein unc-93 homolog A-like [Orbicella faveolata]
MADRTDEPLEDARASAKNLVVDNDKEEAEQLTPEQRKKEKRKITKNVYVISLGFLFLFTAFQSLQNLQSSLNKDEGLGLASLSVIYAALILSCIFVPPFVIGRLGCKWTLVLAMTGYVLYTVANYYARWGTLIPASIIIGICAAPLWSSKCAYLTTTGIRYAELNRETQDAVVTRYFGIFFLIFQSGQIWGNLISSLVLQQGVNDTFRENADEVCGARFCSNPPKLTNATDEYDRKLVIRLLSIYLATGVFAVLLIIALLDRLTGSLDRRKEQESGASLLIATAKHLTDMRMLLVLPLTMFSGLEQAFTFADFTAAFVTCSLGIHRVGFVMICFGATDAFFSLTLGRLTKYTGRIPVFISGAVIHIAVITVMLIWRPNYHLVWVFYVIAALLGYCDAVWQTQINAMYGVFFHDNQEAAFSNYRLWESLGFVLAFAYSKYLCIHVKLIILLVVLIVSLIGYFTAEYVNKSRIDQAYSLADGMALDGRKSDPSA